MPSTSIDTASSEPPAPSRRRSNAALGLVVVLLATPALLALVHELSDLDLRGPPSGDAAVLEIGVLEAARGHNLLGPYSRFGWHHPGPLYIYLLVPLYSATDHATGALHVTAILIGLGSVLTTLFVGARVFPRPIAIATLGLALALVVRHIAATYAPSPFAETWNPVVTILPLGALSMLCVHFASGSRGAGVVALGVHAFLCQTHVAYVPVASVTLGLGAAFFVVTRRREGARPRDPHFAVAAALLFAVAWAPPIADQVHGSGNFGAMISFFRWDGRSHIVPAAALDVALDGWSAPVRSAIGLGRAGGHTLDAFAIVFAVVTVGTLLIGAVRAVRGRHHDATAAATITLAGLLTAGGSTLGIDDVRNDYIVGFAAIVGGLALPIGALVLLGDGGPSWIDRLGTPLTVLVLCVVSFGLGTKTVAGYTYRERHRDAFRARSVPRALADAALPYVRDTTPHPFAARTENTWPHMAGTLLVLAKRGEHPVVDPSYAFMFGDAFSYADDIPRALIFANRPLPYARLVQRVGPIYLHIGIAARVGPRTVPMLRVVNAPLVRGHTRAITDGRWPPRGTAPRAPSTIALETNAFVDVALPAIVASNLRLSCEGDDVYEVSASENGAHFASLGIARCHPGAGMRDTRFALPSLRTFEILRIRPHGGTLPAHLGEVAIDASEDVTLVDFGSPQARDYVVSGFSTEEERDGLTFSWIEGTKATITLPLSPRTRHALELSAGPLYIEGRTQTLHVLVGGAEIGRVAMRRGIAPYRFAIPAEHASARTTMTFRLSYAEAPSAFGASQDTRRLSARLGRLVVTAE